MIASVTLGLIGVASVSVMLFILHGFTMELLKSFRRHQQANREWHHKGI